VSDTSAAEEEDSEPDSLLDIDGALDVGFTGSLRVTAGPRSSGSPADYNLKPLDYSGLAPADSIVFQL
jgi:hypothetical protein